MKPEEFEPLDNSDIEAIKELFDLPKKLEKRHLLPIGRRLITENERLRAENERLVKGIKALAAPVITHFTKTNCGIPYNSVLSESDSLTDVNCQNCLRKVQERFESHHTALYELGEEYIACDGHAFDVTENARVILLAQGFIEICKHGNHVRENLAHIDCDSCKYD